MLLGPWEGAWLLTIGQVKVKSFNGVSTILSKGYQAVWSLSFSICT